MAFVIGEEFDAKIRAIFDCKINETETQENDDMKPLFKKPKKLIIKLLNRKWDILLLESYISNKIIQRDLSERVIPATH